MLSVSAMLKLFLFCVAAMCLGIDSIDPDPPNTCTVTTTSVSVMTTPAASVPTGIVIPTTAVSIPTVLDPTISISSSASAVNPAPGKYNIICPFEYLSDSLTVWNSVLFYISL